MRYEPATRAKPSATGCQSGSKALGRAIRDVYPELQSLSGPYGCWNPRRIEGSGAWSLHAEGRALDVGCPVRMNATGWSVACHLVERRVLYGTMRVMWDGHIWSTEQRLDWRPLHPSTNQHRDHFHVEQFWHAALRPLDASYAEFCESLQAHRASAPVPT